MFSILSNVSKVFVQKKKCKSLMIIQKKLTLNGMKMLENDKNSVLTSFKNRLIYIKSMQIRQEVGCLIINYLSRVTNTM